MVYGSIRPSVGKLFLAGFVPGLLMTIFLMVAVTVVATREIPARPLGRLACAGVKIVRRSRC